MTYVPAYMGNASRTEATGSFGSDDSVSIQHVLDVEEMPVKQRSSGLWDIQVQI